jgi:hypothetical protein
LAFKSGILADDHKDTVASEAFKKIIPFWNYVAQQK